MRRDDATGAESLQHYEVDFASLEPTFAQTVGLLPGAVPIGAAADQNDIPQMYFLARSGVWYLQGGPDANHFQDGLPPAIVGLRLHGPLLACVGEKSEGERTVQFTSLRHRGRQLEIPITGRLLSEPLLWSRWLFTVEMDRDRRISLLRRELDLGGTAGRGRGPTDTRTDR